MLHYFDTRGGANSHHSITFSQYHHQETIQFRTAEDAVIKLRRARKSSNPKPSASWNHTLTVTGHSHERYLSRNPLNGLFINSK